METWTRVNKKLREDHQSYMCLCSRLGCKRSRVEGFLSGLSEYEQRKIIHAPDINQAPQQAHGKSEEKGPRSRISYFR